ncbi:unnamed protein product, partial [Prorocentrum cordatum]
MQDLQQKTWKRSLCALPPPPPPPETAGTRVTKARLGQPAPGEKSGTAPWPAGPLCWKRRMEAAGSAGRGKKKKKKSRTNKGADEEEEESKAEFVPYRSATLTLSASGSEQISATGMPKLCRDSLGELEGREGRGSRSSRSSRAGARTGGREVSRTSAGPSLAARSRTRLL